MVPKDIGTDVGYVGSVVPQRIYNSPNFRRRHGPVTRQPSAQEEIHLACMKGNLTTVQNLIDSGRVGVDSVLNDGWTPLMVSASAARPTVLEYLLSKQGDPNFSRKDNFTALMAATGSSQPREDDILSCVSTLLKAGAQVNIEDNNGLMPLGFAVKANRIAVAKSLIESGANINALDKNGKNCLFYAAEKGYGQMARFLLEEGVDINIVDKSGWMVCETAVEKGHIRLGELLFRARESCWRPGKSPLLMSEFNDVPLPTQVEPDSDTGEGIVNTLTNIQTQVKSLSNLVNSVRLRMVQDAVTKQYEVETGKMGEVAIFARSMQKSCTILSNEVSSLSILVDEETTESLKESYTRKVMSLGYGRILSETEGINRNTRWDLVLAGAAGVLLLCYISPQLRGRLATTMKIWQL